MCRRAAGKARRTVGRVPLVVSASPNVSSTITVTLTIFGPHFSIQLVAAITNGIDVRTAAAGTLGLVTCCNGSMPITHNTTRPLVHRLSSTDSVRNGANVRKFSFPRPGARLLLSGRTIRTVHSRVVTSTRPIAIVPVNPLAGVTLLLGAFPRIGSHVRHVILVNNSIAHNGGNIVTRFGVFISPRTTGVILASNLSVAVTALSTNLKAIVPPRGATRLGSVNGINLVTRSLFRHCHGHDFNTNLGVCSTYTITYLLRPSLFSVAGTFISMRVTNRLATKYAIISLGNCLGHRPGTAIAANIRTSQFYS